MKARQAKHQYSREVIPVNKMDLSWFYYFHIPPSNWGVSLIAVVNIPIWQRNTVTSKVVLTKFVEKFWFPENFRVFWWVVHIHFTWQLHSLSQLTEVKGLHWTNRVIFLLNKIRRERVLYFQEGGVLGSLKLWGISSVFRKFEYRLHGNIPN